jgi:hypothetical protein
MRFTVGDIYQLADGRRTAVVTQIHSDSRLALITGSHRSRLVRRTP